MGIVRTKHQQTTGRLAIVALLTVTMGCGTTARNVVPSRIATSSGWIDLNATNQSPAAGPHSAQRLSQYTAGLNDGPRNVLALSGGGMYGAFSAGVLNGWSDIGSRPTFDAVTGVSTGALIATFAFLGPAYDAELKRVFTTTSDRDIFRRRGLLAPFRTESVATTEPLKQLIATHITADVLARVADAHARGRRLYVGTTNLDTRRLVIWDMGAIASRGELQLYRDVILASAAIPSFFPPVRIEVEVNGRRYTEMHADGGVAAQVFVQRSVLSRSSTVWVISAGKLHAEPAYTGTRTLDIGASALNAMVYAQTRSDIRRVAAVAHETKAEFRLTAIPDSFPVDSTEQLFDPVVMGKLFDIGFTLGRSGPKGWVSDPPPPDDLEASPPRTGVQFLAPEPVLPRVRSGSP